MTLVLTEEVFDLGGVGVHLPTACSRSDDYLPYSRTNLPSVAGSQPHPAAMPRGRTVAWQS